METTSTARERSRAVGVCALVVLATWLVWWRTTAFAFTNLDDDLNLLANPHFRGLGRAQLAWMAGTRWMGHWQPLTWLSYAFDFARGGLQPRAYHTTQVVLHGLGAAAVFALARALLADLARARGAALELAAAVAALSWSLHPLRAEPVAWVTGRNDVLALPFLALAALAWWRRGAPRAAKAHPALPAVTVGCALAGAFLALAALSPSTQDALRMQLAHPALLPLGLLAWAAAVGLAARRGGGAAYVGACCALVAAGLAKEIALALPAVFVVLDLLGGRRLRASLVELAPPFAFALVLGVLALWARDVPGDVPPDWAGRGPSQIAGQAALALVFTPWKTLVPRGLTPIHDLTGPLDLAQPAVWAALALLALAAWAAVAQRRRAPAVGAALAAYALLALPTLGLVRFGTAWVGERYSHVNALPWHLLAAAAWLAWRRREAPESGWARAAALALLAVLAQRARTAAEAWRDSERLWNRALAVEETPRALVNLALVQAAQAEGAPPDDPRRALAVELSARALALAEATRRPRPEYERAHALALQGVGRYDEAREHYLRYLAARPDDSEARLRVVLCLEGAGRHDEARAAAAEYSARDPEVRRRLEALLGGQR